MMTKPEELAGKNKSNYQTYLSRMDSSFLHSTKGLIPFYAAGCRTVLDVGCASGTVMEAVLAMNPEVRAVGIDINEAALVPAREKGLEVYRCSLAEVNRLNMKFDCVVFSSVLHEFASYDEIHPFQPDSVKDALKQSHDLLNPEGIVVIRDGLEVSDRHAACELSFADRSDLRWFERFVKEYKGIGLHPYQWEIREDKVYGSLGLIQEFLATYTWGAESWNREINEKYCFFSEQEWETLLSGEGFEAVTVLKSREEYPAYLNAKASVRLDGKKFFPYMTTLIVAKSE